MVARILIDSSVKGINKVFDYLIPAQDEEFACIGKRVLINFGQGKGREEEGIIVAISDKPSKEGMRLKKVQKILDTYPVVDKDALHIAKWMSKEYFCNVYDVLKLLFPPGTTAKFSEKKIVGKQTTNVVLAKETNKILEDIEANKFTSGRHIRILKYLIDSGGESLLQDVMSNLEVTKAVVDLIRKKGYINYEKIDVEEENLQEYSYIEKSENLQLTSKQNEVKTALKFLLCTNKYSANLLKGITGSGKTEVYMQLIQDALKMGKGCIVLVPEIALTHQMLERFISRFGNTIAALHSKMSAVERKKQWKRIYDNEAKIVVGARSALFSPVNNLGLVIIDEEHDLSFKSQNTPRYSAVEVAKQICMKKNALLLLGSATPSLKSYKDAQDKKIGFFELNERPGGAKLPEMQIVDMRYEQVRKDRRSKIFSEEFLVRLENAKARGEKTIVFLNRRGHSTYMLCSSCGEVLKCSKCDVSMTYHKSSNLNICHYCSEAKVATDICPNCNQNTLKMNGLGVEQLEEELSRIYNDKVTYIRMDADTTMVKDGHKKILDSFKNENIDVLIGTQMISKGHDIKDVTLVCIVDADSMIGINEYSAAERAFSNMLQVSGRAGRREKEGTVVVQTYNPDSYVIKALEAQEYGKMYENEIQFRQILNYPPFCQIIQIDIYAEDINILKCAGEKMYTYLERASAGLYNANKPQKPFIQKVKNKYRMYIIIKCKLDDEISKRIKFAVDKFEEVEKMPKVRISITKDPIFVG
ncbi:MAG: primosomal protein N' [Clostridia bacterium]